MNDVLVPALGKEFEEDTYYVEKRNYVNEKLKNKNS